MTNKLTVVVGHRAPRPAGWENMSASERSASKWEPESFKRPGFWQDEAAKRAARRFGFVGEITVTHTRMDYSGKGRACDERRGVLSLSE